ncbi:YbhN family protein [Leucobacter albus]|uniref:YbhN family protein n=1 Tax=Leucobacter albus TaxID=272210 RepID=A0ABW3TPV1_9MICO
MTGAWHRSPRFWVSAITLLIVAAIVWAAWPTVLEAFGSLHLVNPWTLSLLVPVQLASFAATGEALFSYLRARGELRGVRPLTAIRMSLEFNFANHMLPSGGAAGITYTSWKLAGLGVAPAKGTLAQLARFGVTFVSFSLLLLAAAIWLIASGRGTAPVMWAAAGVGALAVLAVAGGVLLLGRRRALHRFAGVLTRLANGAGRVLGRPAIAASQPLVRFFDGLHLELRALLAEPRTLLPPFAWSFLLHFCDAGLFWVALASIGVLADPALVFVAYGLATVTSMVITTPNGVGAYEVVMIGLLVAGGLPTTLTVAAITLARVILLLGTIVFGWAFYQHSVARFGRERTS